MGREIPDTDWLPEGWIVQVTTWQTGSKDKCYIDPSNEHKFFSKQGVLHYLNNAGANHSVCEETEAQNTSQPSAVKFVVKQATTEGLPAGWFKELRLTQKGDKTRRDSYYIDPVSGHVFRSMKEVSHYLGTGKTRRRASKPKGQGSSNLEPGQDSLPLAAETEEKKMIAHNEAGNRFIGNQSLTTDTSVMNKASLPEAAKLEQGSMEEETSLEGKPAAEVPLENVQVNELEATKSKSRKRKNVKGADLPRRTSKRLAGIEVDLSLEPTKPTRARRAAGRHTNEADAEVNCADKHENLEANLDEDAKRLSPGKNADLKPETLDVLPPEDVAAIPEEHTVLEMNECKDDQKMEMPVEIPLSELWNDPCIEFAIKTLTGAMPIGDDNEMTMNQGASSNLPNVVADTRQDLPSTDIWADPCFEFAVKTLTSDLPMENDPPAEAMLRQSSYSSSQTKEHSSLSFASVSSGGFSHASDPLIHGPTVEAMLKQPSYNSSQTKEQSGLLFPGASSGGFSQASNPLIYGATVESKPSYNSLQTKEQSGLLLATISSGGFSHASSPLIYGPTVEAMLKQPSSYVWSGGFSHAGDSLTHSNLADSPQPQQKQQL